MPRNSGCLPAREKTVSFACFNACVSSFCRAVSSSVPLKASPADSIKLCAAKAAGYVARICTAHAVAHNEERGPVVLPRFDPKKIS